MDYTEKYGKLVLFVSITGYFMCITMSTVCGKIFQLPADFPVLFWQCQSKSEENLLCCSCLGPQCFLFSSNITHSFMCMGFNLCSVCVRMSLLPIIFATDINNILTISKRASCNVNILSFVCVLFSFISALCGCYGRPGAVAMVDPGYPS